MPELFIMMKPASGLCNLHCDYCFYRDETENREKSSFGFMKEYTLKQVIKRALSYAEGECTFVYQGGEPTLCGIQFYQKAVEFQRKYNVKNVHINNVIQTNGYVLSEEWARFFAEFDFLVGVSLDGIKRTHDKVRHNIKGEGTFEQVLNNIRMLEYYHVRYNILTVVNLYTASEISRIYNFFKKKRFYYLQFIPCLDPIGEMWGNKEYSLRPDVYGEFLKTLFDLWYEDLKRGEQPYIRQFENIGEMLLGGVPEACDQRGVCGMQYIVEADGSIYPCDFFVLDQYKLGNICIDDWDVIDQKRKAIRFIEESKDLSDKCVNCEYYYLCRGGCKRYRISGETEESIHYYCESYKMFFAYTIQRWNIIMKRLIQENI